MLAGDKTPEAPLIEVRDELVAHIEQGEKPFNDWRIGTEHEKFPFYRSGLRPVPYDGDRGIEALLHGFSEKFGWRPVYDKEYVIALNDPCCDLGGSITLEPGGQFELSGAPLKTLFETRAEIEKHLAQVREIAEPLGISFLGIGFSPLWSRAETPRMPKSRYDIMTAYMPTVGGHGLDMMYRSATVQVNLDFSSEADMVKKLRVSLALQPIAIALFANSPFTEGKPNGFLSYRSAVWLDTDPARTGMLPFAFEDGMGYERYVDYALDVPMYFVRRGKNYINTAGGSFRAFMQGKLPQLPGERPTIVDWSDHLTTLFPEVRLKRYLEMRGADCGSSPFLTALPALWTGILYDSASLDAAYELVKDWPTEELLKLRAEVPRTALATRFRGRTVRDFALEVLAISEAGLKRRGIFDAGGKDESAFLAPLQEVAITGVTPAQAFLEKYYGPWSGSVLPVFEEAAY